MTLFTVHLFAPRACVAFRRVFVFVAAICLLGSKAVAAPEPIVLTGSDRRPATSLNGEWASIVDPYFSGLFSFHHEEKKNGFFVNHKAKPGDPFPTEYDFSKAPKLKVPGDWNTQRRVPDVLRGTHLVRERLHLQPKTTHASVSSHRRSQLSLVVLGQRTKSLRARRRIHRLQLRRHHGHSCGNNFVVAAVDNTRHEDGVPTLQTDWWNYGGLTREVSLIEVPETFIDQYDLHLSRSEDSRDRRLGPCRRCATRRQRSKSKFPSLHAKTSADIDADGRAALHFTVQGLERWSPENRQSSTRSQFTRAATPSTT